MRWCSGCPASSGGWSRTGDGSTRLVGTTDEPFWYARQLTALQAPYLIASSPELREAARDLGRRLTRAGSAG